MLISYKWLQTYFDKRLPQPEEIADKITMHAFEIENIERKGDDTIFDVKVLPNRAHDCLSHRGIATEIAALFDIPMNETRFEKYEHALSDGSIEISIEDLLTEQTGKKLCSRYVGRLIESVQVRLAQPWIVERLETLGQRSINNIVDICNYVMFDIGQPMHAFDADKVKGTIVVRMAHSGEMITTLDNKKVILDENMLVIADDQGPLAIAGIKGGNRAEVDLNTTRIILEAAHFNSSSIRKTSQKLGIKTDASKRFENEITPSLAKVGIEYATALIVENISREVVVHESVDIYTRRQNPYKVGVSLNEINRLLGTTILEEEVASILKRFGFEWEMVEPLEKIITTAPQFVGIPYRLGASVSYDAPKEFDCSSYTCFLYREAGINIPRISVDQYVFGELVNEKNAVAGDLIFSNTGVGKIHHESIEWLNGTEVPEGVDHVGLYLGNGMVIHASKINKGVLIEKVSESERFRNVVGFRRMTTPEKRFVVTVPTVRLDMRIKEDLIEDIGRVYGYDRIPTRQPEKALVTAKINKLFYYSQKIRNILMGMGFDEIQTYAFQQSGEIELENPLASDKKFLRTDLCGGMRKALEVNTYNAELLGLDEVKIFEIGNVFRSEKEDMRIGLGIKNIKKDKIKEEQKITTTFLNVFEELGCILPTMISNKGDSAEISFAAFMNELPEPENYSGELFVVDSGKKYQKISPYPFVLRDIAVWVPAETQVHELQDIIMECSGPLLARNRLFDTFTKEFDTGEKKTSYAFRLVFQSNEKTLSDDEVNEVMTHVNEKIRTKGWEVR